jgi:hypothetical protein
MEALLEYHLVEKTQNFSRGFQPAVPPPFDPEPPLFLKKKRRVEALNSINVCVL